MNLRSQKVPQNAKKIDKQLNTCRGHHIQDTWCVGDRRNFSLDRYRTYPGCTISHQEAFSFCDICRTVTG